MSNAIPDNIIQLPTFADQDTHANCSIFDLANLYGIEDLHFKNDPVTGLKAIVAIHNTSRGPALGGTRCMTYASEYDAINDVIRLARGMSYKSAFADLPFGGGKAVLIRPDHIKNRDAYFERYGDFLNTFKGRFITAVDVGTSVADMDIIACQTNYVLSTSASNGDPSEDTARGVFHGIKAAIKICFKRNNLEGSKVAIQGVGKVGFHLAQFLYQQGVKLFITDINPEAELQCRDLFQAEIVSAKQIYSIDCDVFAPCALGSCINEITVPLINAKVICGAANNQLSSNKIGDMLHEKKIFFVPDFVVNVGGLIHVVIKSKKTAQAKVSKIYDTVINLYQNSKKLQQPSHRVANQIAEQILTESKKAFEPSLETGSKS